MENHRATRQAHAYTKSKSNFFGDFDIRIFLFLAGNKPWLPTRYIIVIMGFFGLINIFALRVHMSVGIVAMVNNTAQHTNNSVVVLDACPEPINSGAHKTPVSVPCSTKLCRQMVSYRKRENFAGTVISKELFWDHFSMDTSALKFPELGLRSGSVRNCRSGCRVLLRDCCLCLFRLPPGWAIKLWLRYVSYREFRR